MNFKLNLSLANLREYYIQILVFLVLFVLILKVLFPQIENLATSQELLAESNNKLESLNIRVKFLESLDKTASRQKLQRLNLALPADKDVGLMLDALTRIASRSNVRLGNVNLSMAVSNSKIGLPEVQATLNLKGETVDIIKFITEISKTLPVMQATNVSLKGSSTTLVISFYYKPSEVKEVSRQILEGAPRISKNQEEIFAKILEREAPSTIFLESENQPTGARADPFR